MLRIIITGENKSGRSTLAKHLQEYLNEKGLNVNLKDEELSSDWHRENDRRMNLLSEVCTPVEIKVV